MIPSESELLTYLKRKNNLVNFSMIAKNFEIKNATVTDLIAALEKRKLVTVKKIGGQNIVMVKE